MAVEMYKLDGRMLHGQVLSTFGRILNPDEFLVVNEEVANDDSQRIVLEIAVPAGAEFDVVSPKTYGKIFQENDYWGTKTFVVFRYITDVVEAYKAGAKIPVLNAAGFYQDPKSKLPQTNYGVNLWITEEDKKNLRWLEDQGVKLIYRVSHLTSEEPLSKYVKY